MCIGNSKGIVFKVVRGNFILPKYILWFDSLTLNGLIIGGFSIMWAGRRWVAGEESFCQDWMRDITAHAVTQSQLANRQIQSRSAFTCWETSSLGGHQGQVHLPLSATWIATTLCNWIPVTVRICTGSTSFISFHGAHMEGLLSPSAYQDVHLAPTSQVTFSGLATQRYFCLSYLQVWSGVKKDVIPKWHCCHLGWASCSWHVYIQ